MSLSELDTTCGSLLHAWPIDSRWRPTVACLLYIKHIFLQEKEKSMSYISIVAVTVRVSWKVKCSQKYRCWDYTLWFSGCAFQTFKLEFLQRIKKRHSCPNGWSVTPVHSWGWMLPSVSWSFPANAFTFHLFFQIDERTPLKAAIYFTRPYACSDGGKSSKCDSLRLIKFKVDVKYVWRR